MKFTYKAIDPSATLITGEIQANSIRDAEMEIRRKELKIVSLRSKSPDLKLIIQRRLPAE